MFNVITVSREYGSGGGIIAEMLAKNLGWKLVDKSLVDEVARRAQIAPEVAARFDSCVDPWFHRLVKALWRGGYEGVATAINTDIIDSETVAGFGGEVIREAASLGQCVIVGRGSQCLLRKRGDTFHVSIFGPRHAKIQRLRERLAPGTDVERVMDQMDRQRAAYINRLFGEDWRDRRLYHIVISSGLGLEKVADTILCAARLTPHTP
ncbi:MAG: cytidylate kinase-like family protein [Acidobacteria bacterium]|nr:cytidylate kinase-like family protein [Acidobacteriota bacterium]